MEVNNGKAIKEETEDYDPGLLGFERPNQGWVSLRPCQRPRRCRPRGADLLGR